MDNKKLAEEIGEAVGVNSDWILPILDKYLNQEPVGFVDNADHEDGDIILKRNKKIKLAWQQPVYAHPPLNQEPVGFMWVNRDNEERTCYRDNQNYGRVLDFVKENNAFKFFFYAHPLPKKEGSDENKD